MPPGLIGLKVLVMMNSLQNIVILGAQGLLMLMGSKFLIKMTRPQNTKEAQLYSSNKTEHFSYKDGCDIYKRMHIEVLKRRI